MLQRRFGGRPVEGPYGGTRTRERGACHAPDARRWWDSLAGMACREQGRDRGMAAAASDGPAAGDGGGRGGALSRPAGPPATRCHRGQPDGGSEPGEPPGAAALPPGWDARGTARAARAAGDDAPGPPPALAEELCGVPDLPGRVFPPAMRRWRGGPASCQPGGPRAWSAWAPGGPGPRPRRPARRMRPSRPPRWRPVRGTCPPRPWGPGSRGAASRGPWSPGRPRSGRRSSRWRAGRSCRRGGSGGWGWSIRRRSPMCRVCPPRRAWGVGRWGRPTGAAPRRRGRGGRCARGRRGARASGPGLAQMRGACGTCPRRRRLWPGPGQPGSGKGGRRSGHGAPRSARSGSRGSRGRSCGPCGRWGRPPSGAGRARRGPRGQRGWPRWRHDGPGSTRPGCRPGASRLAVGRSRGRTHWGWKRDCRGPAGPGPGRLSTRGWRGAPAPVVLAGRRPGGRVPSPCGARGGNAGGRTRSAEGDASPRPPCAPPTRAYR